MRIASGWSDYTLLDATGGERLEQWGDIVLIRPDPAVLWRTPRAHPLWKDAHARYHRASSGGGHWERFKPIPDSWQIGYPLGGACSLRFNLKPMGFKHTGLFPEQAVNWQYMFDLIQRTVADRPLRVLNLFGYTGAATLACAAAGAHTTHVDAAKGMVAWGKENAAASGLSDKPLRWLVDDCLKFVRREQRRGNAYDAILMDPPSYGRGPGGEVWKLEEQIYPLLEECVKVLSPDPLFVMVNSYTAGLSPSTMGYMLDALLAGRFAGRVTADEIGLPVADTGRALPCGGTAVWQAALK